MIRHVRKWLNAGILEQGRLMEQEEGVPQGGSISPLLANVYLHYALDLWAQQWRRRQARGDMVIVRYADDFVVGIQNLSEAEQFPIDLKGDSADSGWNCIPRRRGYWSSDVMRKDQGSLLSQDQGGLLPFFSTTCGDKAPAS